MTEQAHNVGMATQPNTEELWTVREYLRSTWSPDREFVEGRIEERNLGEKEHSIIQGYLTALFWNKRTEWAIRAFPELRTQTQSAGFVFLTYWSRAPAISSSGT